MADLNPEVDSQHITYADILLVGSHTVSEHLECPSFQCEIRFHYIEKLFLYCSIL
jgi:hypothetical protein